ncbi:alpha-xylosidase [Actinoalloteichus caeruleus]|uniref:alpha-xylosidase n=1 Tax=Actinoalloteichus cyanogriseus TaxID=2893586 RepID=UPI003AB055DD
MKFTNGVWLMRDGVRASYATEARDVVTTGETVTVHAATRAVRHRGDTLYGPVLTTHWWTPAPDVIAVRTTHFAGGRPRSPEFSLAVEPDTTAKVERVGPVVELTSGRLSLRLDTSAEWSLDFLAEGRVLTRTGRKGTGIAVTEEDRHYSVAQLSLGVGELVYGLGERFTPLVRNGQVVDIWQADAGTGSEQSYKNVPFYLTNRGYGVFVNEPGQTSFEVASEHTGRVQFSTEGQTLEYLVIYGPTPKEILSRYTALLGRPALPPAWSFGLWLSTSFTTSYDEETVTGFIEGMRDRSIPLSVFHFDCFWMREYQWCDFEWDPAVFPDPPGMLRRLHDRGLRVSVWINPYIGQKSPLFEEGLREGYLLRRPNGDVWQWDLWQPGLAIVDFTNPAARAWYSDKLRGLLAMGVDCFKTDFGERIPTDVVFHDGSDPVRMHNYYTHLFNQTVFEVLREQRGDGEAVVFGRSATAGGQRFPVHWGGDSESTFESMAESLRGGLSLGLSGFGFWSHDIGGFEGTPDPGVFKRWLAFGLLSSHSRLHGSRSYRVPWEFDEESVEVARFFTELKCRLMPYLYGAAAQAADHGWPVMRSMGFGFPDDPACDYLDRQYLLGDDLLVAPVLSADGEVEYYVPSGRWTHLVTGEPVEGPGWRRERHGFLGLPVLVRPGAVVPLGGRSDRPDYDYTRGLTLRVGWSPELTRTRTAVPTLAGETGVEFETTRTGATLTVRVVAGAAAGWRVLVVGVAAVTAVRGGTWEPHEQGVLLSATGAELSVVVAD